MNGMSTSPFDIAKSLNEKTDLEYPISDYSPWMINKIFSLTKDTLFFANAMNKLYLLDVDVQRDFYKTAVPKGKRYAKWHKKEKTLEKSLNILSKPHFGRHLVLVKNMVLDLFWILT